MSTSLHNLEQISAAIDRLLPEERAKLFEDLRLKLLSEGVLPQPRLYSKELIDRWVASDDADMRRFRHLP